MKPFRRTRIVATIGPSSSSVAMLSRMMRAGLTIARLNFSHGTHENHAMLISHIRTAAHKTNSEVAILQDLQGQKIRIGDIEDMELVTGEQVVLCAGAKGRRGEIPVQYSRLARDLKKGDRILLNDGFVELSVSKISGTRVHAKVVQGGPLSSHKGVNFPDTAISAPVFTDKDREDLRFGVQQGVDFVALSFVSKPEDVVAIKKVMTRYARQYKKHLPKIVVKIERKEILDSFIHLLGVVDGIMVARGDLGLEMQMEEVPLVQKEITDMCRVAGVPVIVATHMLESMTKRIRPTRAEVSDVANAVLDHADGVMLSAETATGDHPYSVIQTMDRVVRETEYSHLDDLPFNYPPTEDEELIISQTIHKLAASRNIHGVVMLADQERLLGKISSYRPEAPLFVFTSTQFGARQLLLRSGVVPCVEKNLSMGSFEKVSHRHLVKGKYIRTKDPLAYIFRSSDGRLQLTVK